MRQLNRFTAVGAFILMCAISASSQTTQGKTNGPNDSSWQTFELGDKSFAVLLPAKPEESIKRDADKTTYMYTVSLGGSFFMCISTLLPEEAEKWSESADQAYYDGFWEGFSSSIDEQLKASNTKVKLAGRQKISFAGHDGVEFRFSFAEFHSRFLMTRVGRYSFAAAAFATDDLKAADQEKFLDSFTIIKPLPVRRGLLIPSP